jgi:capsular exopolysaccharide synthesis family protein
MSAPERSERTSSLAPARADGGGGEIPSRAWGDLRRRWPLVVAVVIASVAVLVASHERKAKSYSATASVAFQSATLSDSALQVTPAGSSEPQREADTEVLIAHSPEVAEAVRQQLHIQAGTSELLSLVKVEAAPTADVLNVVAATGDPQYSARLANAFAEQYIAFQTKSQLAGIETAQGKLEQQIRALPVGSAERPTLIQSLQRLAALRAVAGGDANIIGRATPPASPSGAGLAETAVIGLLVGLALALALVFLLESLDRRIKTIEEFEQGYRLPALAGIPQAAFRAARRSDWGSGEMLEPYRILRSALDFTAVARRLDTLLVTSAVAGEGKTTVAVNLAHAVALTGRRTVLVEFDLRRPTFAAHFDMDPSIGLTTALTGGAPLGEMLVQPLHDLPNLLVLPAGLLPHNPSEMLGSARIAEVIAELAAGESMVIIDAPPLNPVADAQVLLNAPTIDATIVVARANRTTRDAVRRARAILDRHIVEPVGVVITGIRDEGRYGYGSYTSTAPMMSESVEASSMPPDRARAVESRPRVAEVEKVDTDVDASSGDPLGQARLAELQARVGELQARVAEMNAGGEVLSGDPSGQARLAELRAQVGELRARAAELHAGVEERSPSANGSAAEPLRSPR